MCATAATVVKYQRQKLRDRSTAVSSLNIRPRSHNNNLRLGTRSIFVFSGRPASKVHKFVSWSHEVKNESFLITFL